MRVTAALCCLGILIAACAPDEEVAPSPGAPTSTLSPSATAPPRATSPPVITTPPGAPSPTEAPPETIPFVAVAWERGSRLVLLADRGEPMSCPAPSESACGPLVIVREVELPAAPHNVAAFGQTVLITHPEAGLVSRYDVASGELKSAQLGTEPHDVKFARDGSTAYVADEAGRRLMVINPVSLEVRQVLPLPAQPHDIAVDGSSTLWVTLIGRNELAHIENGMIELFAVGGAPHDLVVDGGGSVWFSHWGSPALSIFDPASGVVAPADAGVEEPHHFTLGPDGVVWVSDNGGSAVVGFLPGGALTVPVGPTPHHLGFVRDLLAVAVSGSGEVVIVQEGRVVGRISIGSGLHGLAVGEVPAPAAWSS